MKSTRKDSLEKSAVAWLRALCKALESHTEKARKNAASAARRETKPKP
jgi:hypothetical protein